jgi:hypothetical protein
MATPIWTKHTVVGTNTAKHPDGTGMVEKEYRKLVDKFSVIRTNGDGPTSTMITVEQRDCEIF